MEAVLEMIVWPVAVVMDLLSALATNDVSLEGFALGALVLATILVVAVHVLGIGWELRDDDLDDGVAAG